MIYEIDFGKAYDSLVPPYSRFLTKPFRQYPLPTEFVVSEPKYCVPTYGRIYETDLYILQPGKHEGVVQETVVDYETLRQTKCFTGTVHYEAVYLSEVWEDWGDDGRTCMYIRGWRFIKGSKLKSMLEDDKYPGHVFRGPNYD